MQRFTSTGRRYYRIYPSYDQNCPSQLKKIISKNKLSLTLNQCAAISVIILTISEHHPGTEQNFGQSRKT